MTGKKEVRVLVREWVLQVAYVVVEAGPEDDIEALAREAALNQDDWESVDSNGFEYRFENPFGGGG